MGGLIDSPEYRNTTQVFQPNLTQTNLQQNPLIQELMRMQGIAARRASNQATSNMFQSGLGRSTFTPQVSAAAGTQAASPYISQVAETGQNLMQQNTQNFMNLLGQNIGREQFSQNLAQRQAEFMQQIKMYEEEQKRKEQERQNNLLLGLLGGGFQAFTNPIGALLGGVGSYLSSQNTPGQGRSGYLSGYRPVVGG